MKEVLIYSRRFCGYTGLAERLIDSKGVDYKKIDVTFDREKRRWLLEATGQGTVPQIFVDGKSYGGFSDISALESRGELDRILGVDPE